MVEHLWTVGQLKRSGLVTVPDVAELPDEANPPRDKLLARGLGAFATVAIMDADVLVGTTGISTSQTRDEWDEGTLELLRVGARLFGEAMAMAYTQAELVKSRESLALAQRIARVGSWEMDLITSEVTGSEEIYRIFGVPKDGAESLLEVFMQAIHPDDREGVSAALERALVHDDYSRRFRVVLPSGETRTVHSQGEVVMEGGLAVRMFGTTQDITAAVQAEDGHGRYPAALGGYLLHHG